MEKRPFEMDSASAGTVDKGTDNPAYCFSGEEPNSAEGSIKMSDTEIDRQDSTAPLKINAVNGDEDAIVDITTGSRPDDSTGQELVCGIGSCRPKALQWIAGGPKAFAFWSTLYLLIKTAGTVYIGAVLYTIEKQFKLSSTESGAIVILNDVMDMSLVIFVAYFGHKGHRPRIMAFGILLSGIGIFMCGIPHFLLEPYTNVPKGCNQTTAFIDYCTLDGNDKEDDPCLIEYEQPGFNPVWWLIMGQILLGIGNVPVKPLGTTYIDDAVGKHTTPIYIAFLFIAVSIGPLMGFLLGSSALALFVDFDRVAPEDQPRFSQYDPRFIGAWWLGFVCIGAVVCLLSIPFFFFPRVMPKSKERQEEDDKNASEEAKEELEMKTTDSKKEMNGDAGKEVAEVEEEKKPMHMTFFLSIKQMVMSYKKMLMNMGLLLLCLSSAMEGANGAALGAFSLKYYNVEFAVSASTSSTLATIVFPFNLVGSLVGGVVIRRRKWSPAKCALFLIFGDVVSLLLVPFFLGMGCQTQAIAGVSTPYIPPPPFDTMAPISNPITLPGSVQQAASSCNSNCTCGGEAYDPVCGSDGITYVSPCYAGCLVVEDVKDENNVTLTKTYSECGCIGHVNDTAVDGECMPVCQAWHVPVLIVVSIVLIFCSGLGQSGMVLITLRIVEEDMRSAALGFQAVFLNLLGFFPAPIYFGAAINLACILWQYSGGERGSCWAYDRDMIRYTFHGLQGLLKVLAMVFFFGVYFVLRTKKGDKYESHVEEKEEKYHKTEELT